MKLILGFLFLYSYTVGYGQENTNSEFDIQEHSIHLPHTFKTWRYKQALGFSLIYLPKDWLESASSLPMVYYKSNFTMPGGIMIHADIKTVIAASDIALGASWNKAIGSKLFFGAGYQASYGLGMLYDLGYDNTLTVIGHRPFIKLGYLYRDLTFTFKAGIEFSDKIQFDAGSTSLSGNIESLNGYNFSLFLEQRMFKNKSFALGFTSNFNKFHILGWPAFTYTKNIYYVPEFTTLFNF
jgi:hypothetical protein